MKIGSLVLAVAIAQMAVLPPALADEAEFTPWVTVWAYPDADVWFTMGVAREPSKEALSALETATGHPVEVCDDSAISGRLSATAERNGLVVKGSAAVAPLIAFAAGSPPNDVEVGFTSPLSAHLKVSLPQPEYSSEEGRQFAFSTVSGAEPMPPLQFEFGFPTRRLVAYAGFLGGAMLVLALCVLWRRKTALRQADQEPAAAWFSYFRSCATINVAGAYVAVCSRLVADPGELAAFLLNQDRPLLFFTISFAAFLIPAAALSVFTAAVSYPVCTRVRRASVTRKDLVLQAVLLNLMVAIPLGLSLNFLAAVFEGMPGHAVVLLVLAVLSLLLLLNLWLKSLKAHRERLPCCRLRTSIETIAERAGVKLKDVHILTEGASLLSANAMVTDGDHIILTEPLVERLTIREVNAIAGHEMSHILRRHARRKMRINIAAAVAFTLLAVFADASPLVPTVPQAERIQSILVLSCAVAGWFMFTRYFSRRFEYKADAEGLEFSGDAEAYITGLAKIHQLNYMPQQWSRLSEVTLTHPSLERRLRRIAPRAGIDNDSLIRLLDRGATGDSYYDIPADTLDESKVFNSTVRGRHILANTAIIFALCAAIPTAVAWTVTAYDVSGIERLVAYAAGLAATIAVMIGVAGFLSMAGRRKFKALLLQKLLRREIDLAGLNPALVEFAPDDIPRMYDGFTNSDIGFFFLSGDRMYYYGDSLQFSLLRGQVVSAESSKNGHGFFRQRPLVVKWSDGKGGEGSFCVSSYEPVHAARVNAANRRLIDSIELWRNGVSQAGAPLPDAGLPDVPDPAGAPLHVPFQASFRAGIQPGFMAFMLCLAVGLLRTGQEPGPAIYAIGSSMLSLMLFHVPYMKPPKE